MYSQIALKTEKKGRAKKMKEKNVDKSGRRVRMTLEPLSPEEKAVAEQNYWIVGHFLRSERLSPDEWFDVVIFRYLLTIERWFRQPELYRYEFISIVWNAMRSAVGNERKKQNRRIKTISLDAPMPNADTLTWADVITEDNLDYIPYLP